MIGNWKKPGCIFHCLETSDDEVSSIREEIQAAGCYGKVSVARFDGERLPYINNLVNLVIVGPHIDVPDFEVRRVLAPYGSAILKGKMVRAAHDGFKHEEYYIIEELCNAGAADPVIMLEGLDRAGEDPALLELLDPGRNHNFLDRYLNVPFDLSGVVFIAAAENSENIYGPVKGFLEIINV